MKLEIRYQILFLTTVVLGLYYITLSAGFNSVDDSRIVAAYGMGEGKSLIDIFRPKGNYYFRPLVELSYYLDNLLWGMHPRFMHLENVLLHLLNTSLVFFIARQAAAAWSLENTWIPQLSALLFAVHPINTESIAWIAGRTDPLAGVFTLSAIWCLMRSLTTERLFYLCPTLLFFALGLLTKEIALCFLPAAILLTLYWPGNLRIRRPLLFVLAGSAFAVIILMFAFVVFNPSFSVFAFIDSKTVGVAADLKISVTALGFYVKKLIIPVPLNFAIDSVSAYYFLLGIAIIMSLPFWLRRKGLPAILFSSCIIFLLPAIIISVKHVAWTPFAERYLYLPSAFFCIGFIGLGAVHSDRKHFQQWLRLPVLAIACCAALITLQRNLVWHDNLLLYQDTVTKSPNFGAVHLELGIALLQNGLTKEARSEFEMAEQLNKRPSLRNRIKENLMSSRILEGDDQGAIDYFYRNFQKKENAYPEFLRLLNKAEEGLANKAVVFAVRKSIYCDMINTYEIIYRKTHDPFNLYQCGILAYRCGNSSGAVKYLRKAVREAPTDTYYSAAAIKWLQKLESEN